DSADRVEHLVQVRLHARAGPRRQHNHAQRAAHDITSGGRRESLRLLMQGSVLGGSEAVRIADAGAASIEDRRNRRERVSRRKTPAFLACIDIASGHALWFLE